MQIDRETKRSKKSRQTDKQGTILYTNKQIFKTGYCAMCEKRDKNAERAQKGLADEHGGVQICRLLGGQTRKQTGKQALKGKATACRQDTFRQEEECRLGETITQHLMLYFMFLTVIRHSVMHTLVLTDTDMQPSNPVITQACYVECHQKPGRSIMQLLSAYTHTHTEKE